MRSEMTDATALADSLDQICGGMYGGHKKRALPNDVREVLLLAAARLRGEGEHHLSRVDPAVIEQVAKDAAWLRANHESVQALCGEGEQGAVACIGIPAGPGAPSLRMLTIDLPPGQHKVYTRPQPAAGGVVRALPAKWQPIETAPDDVRIICAWLGAPGCSEVDTACRFTDHREGDPYWCSPTDRLERYGVPDLWQPFPTLADYELEAALSTQPAPVSATTQALIDLLRERDAAGRAKYGTTLDRTDLSRADWLQHLSEELLDGAGYALAAKREALTAAQAATSEAAGKHRQSGDKGVCQASQRDGIICANDECDIDMGVRSASSAPTPDAEREESAPAAPSTASSLTGAIIGGAAETGASVHGGGAQ